MRGSVLEAPRCCSGYKCSSSCGSDSLCGSSNQVWSWFWFRRVITFPRECLCCTGIGHSRPHRCHRRRCPCGLFASVMVFGVGIPPDRRPVCRTALEPASFCMCLCAVRSWQPEPPPPPRPSDGSTTTVGKCGHDSEPEPAGVATILRPPPPPLQCAKALALFLSLLAPPLPPPASCCAHPAFGISIPFPLTEGAKLHDPAVTQAHGGDPPPRPTQEAQAARPAAGPVLVPATARNSRQCPCGTVCLALKPTPMGPALKLLRAPIRVPRLLLGLPRACTPRSARVAAAQAWATVSIGWVSACDSTAARASACAVWPGWWSRIL